MEIRQLRYFVTVAEELHFARAAARLHIVQPAVSQQIQRLEHELGLRLLDRTSRRVRLTDDGRRILDQARQVLDAANGTVALAGELSRRRVGTIKIGAGTGLEARVERGLAVLRMNHPDLRVQFGDGPVAAQLDALRRGNLDVALARGVTSAPGLEATLAWREEVLIALPNQHPLAARDAVDLVELEGLPVRLPSRQCDGPFHDLVVAACRHVGIEPLLGRSAGSLERTLLEVATSQTEWMPVPSSLATPPGVRTVRPNPPVALPGALLTSANLDANCKAALAAAFGDELVYYGDFDG